MSELTSLIIPLSHEPTAMDKESARVDSSVRKTISAREAENAEKRESDLLQMKLLLDAGYKIMLTQKFKEKNTTLLFVVMYLPDNVEPVPDPEAEKAAMEDLKNLLPPPPPKGGTTGKNKPKTE